MSRGQMVKVDGVFYSPEDLKAKQDREAAAEARAEREAAEFASRVAVKAEDEAVSAIVEAAVAPLRDRLGKLSELVETITETLGDRISACEDACAAKAADGAGEAGSGADGAAGADSGDGKPADPPAKAAKVAKGGAK